MDKITMRGKSFELLLSKEKISGLVANLAEQINIDFKGKNPLVIAVLDGAFIFAADLVREFNFEHRFRFVKLSSYQGMESTGEVKELLSLGIDIKGQDILIIEDIIDTGTTLASYTQLLHGKQPASIKICSLLVKPNSLKHKSLNIDYRGLDISDEFVIGYGLDWDLQGRHLPGIYQLEKKSN